MGEQCHGCRQWEEYHYLNHVPANGKLFFRLMPPQSSASLKIPTKFMKQVAGEISTNIQLKDPSGILWHVKLVKNETGAFLQNGWKDFSVAHGLKNDDFLIFKYIGDSCFEVNILEPSGCEKANSYCLKIKNSFEQEKVNHPVECLSESEGSEGNEEYDGLDEQENVIPKNICLPRYRAFTAEEERRVSQLVQSVHSDSPCFISVMHNANINKGFMLIPRDFSVHLPSHGTRIIVQVTGKRQTWNIGYHVRGKTARLYSCWQYFVRDNGLQIGDICLFELVNKRKNNLKMCVIISRSSTSCSLGREREKEKVVESTSDDISSSINYREEENTQNSEGSEGNEEYDGLDVQENVIPKNICLPRYTAFTAQEERRISQLVQSVHSDSLCFISVMSNANINKSVMWIPRDFSIHLPSHSARLIVQVTGKRQIWNIGYHVRGKRAGLYSCWQYFVRDNGLQIGDICLFELVNKRKNNLKMYVKISRSSTSSNLGTEREKEKVVESTSDDISSSINSTEEENTQNSSGESTEINKGNSNDLLANGKLSFCMAKKTTLSPEEEKRASQLVRAFPTQNPFFVSVIRPYNLVTLSVPAEFTKYLPSKTCYATLQITGAMKIWRAKMCKNGHTCRFLAGWTLFIRESNLLAGDVCLFELTSKHEDDPHFKLGISKAVKEEPL